MKFVHKGMGRGEKAKVIKCLWVQSKLEPSGKQRELLNIVYFHSFLPLRFCLLS